MNSVYILIVVSIIIVAKVLKARQEFCLKVGLNDRPVSNVSRSHQGLTSMLQRARRTVYWPKLQDDITGMVHKCDECQRYGNKMPRPPERQI